MNPLKYLLLVAILGIAQISFAQKAQLINSGALIKESIALCDSGKLNESLTLLNKVSRSDTNYVWALYEKAIVCEADSQYNKAVGYCQEALRLKEDREYEPQIYNTYANTLVDMGKHDEAIQLFNTAINKYPAYSLLYFNKGIAYLTVKNYAEAEACFQKTLLINPYMYSAHYQLGLAAVWQGKMVPGFVSFMSYLLFSPKGKYAGKAINMLQQLSISTDEVLAYKNNRKIYPNMLYQDAEDVLFSKIALDKAYKPTISLDDPISRQMQALIEKLQYTETDSDFWVQYYLPYFKKVYNDGKFEVLVFHMFSNVQIPAIESYVKKNKKQLDIFAEDAGNYFNNIRATRELNFKRRDTVTQRYIFENGELLGKGKLINNGKNLTGTWQGCYSAGNRKSIGKYDVLGQRTGNWLWYFHDGKIKSKEHYVNGKVDGLQETYYIIITVINHCSKITQTGNSMAYLPATITEVPLNLPLITSKIRRMGRRKNITLLGRPYQ